MKYVEASDEMLGRLLRNALSAECAQQILTLRATFEGNVLKIQNLEKELKEKTLLIDKLEKLVKSLELSKT